MSFEEWYRSYHPRLVAALIVLSGDPDAATDAADETMVRALERWERVQSMASREGWCFRVGANLLKRRARRRILERRLLSRPQFLPMPDVEPEVWAAVKSLPLRQREAIALRYVLGFSEPEVAREMGVATGTASATLFAGRARLAVLLGEHSQGELR